MHYERNGAAAEYVIASRHIDDLRFAASSLAIGEYYFLFISHGIVSRFSRYFYQRCIFSPLISKPELSFITPPPFITESASLYYAEPQPLAARPR